MFGVGFFEIIIIAVVALVVIGPKRLPDVMRQAGRLFVHVRRTANDVRSSFDQVIRDAEDEIRREEAQSLRQALQPILDVKQEVSALLTDAHTTASNSVAPLGTHALTPGSSLNQAFAAIQAPQVTASLDLQPAPTPQAGDSLATPQAQASTPIDKV
jgi:sec-independent protein translocase protein TatB